MERILLERLRRMRFSVVSSSLVAGLGALLHFAVPGGAQVVSELPTGDRFLTLETSEVFSVGSILGEDWETFSRIGGVAFDAQGNLYILDADNFRVVKVEPQGPLLAEMGGEGGGPGEFGMPLSFSVTPSGEVRVFDLGQQGFTVFNPDGSFKTTAKMPGSGFFVPPGGLLPHPGGGIVSGGSGGIRVAAGGDVGAEEFRPVDLYELGEEVEVTTVYQAWNPLAALGDRRAETSSAGGIQISSAPQRAFDPVLMVGVLPSGCLAVVDSSTYTIKVVEAGEGVVQTIRRGIPPRKTTRRDQSDEKERQLKEAEEFAASGGGGRAFAVGGTGSGRAIQSSPDQIREITEQRIEGMEFAEEIPVLEEMATDWEGRLWLRRTGARIGETGPIDVVGGEGGDIGTLRAGEFEIPDAFGPGGLTASIERDDMDVPKVVVRRISLH